MAVSPTRMPIAITIPPTTIRSSGNGIEVA